MTKLKGCLGITNKTQDNKYIPFLDFDGQKKALVIQSLYHVQQKYNLHKFYLIESTNGYNAFFLDKLTFEDCIEIIKDAICDVNYLIYAKAKNNITLRIGNDKKFCDIPNTSHLFNSHELSYAHYQFFSIMYDIDLLNGVEITDLRFDNYNEIQLVLFMSKKYGYIEVE